MEITVEYSKKRCGQKWRATRTSGIARQQVVDFHKLGVLELTFQNYRNAITEHYMSFFKLFDPEKEMTNLPEAQQIVESGVFVAQLEKLKEKNQTAAVTWLGMGRFNFSDLLFARQASVVTKVDAYRKRMGLNIEWSNTRGHRTKEAEAKTDIVKLPDQPKFLMKLNSWTIPINCRSCWIKIIKPRYNLRLSSQCSLSIFLTQVITSLIRSALLCFCGSSGATDMQKLSFHHSIMQCW